MSSEPKPHSAEYFGDQRDFWWNRDFIDLMAKRWQLAEARTVLDVGSGVGHWSRVLAPFLSPDAALTGLEREPKWVAEAQWRAQAAGLSGRLRYQQGDALALPFADDSFDLVTCQTLLIHLPDARAGLVEMLRVLKPGGLLAVAEPNNFGSAFILGSTRFGDPLEALLRLAGLQIACERGKAALGEGHNSIGELLPGFFSELGLTGLQVYQSDRATWLVPPYETASEQANLRQSLEWDERDFHLWGHDETRRYFLAGGGQASQFDSLWAETRATDQRIAAALRARTEHQAGGGAHYLVSGRKP